jgi:hypothetical protein
VARDVSAARASLNFSDWPHGNATWERKRWRRIAREVENGEMPPASYARMHRQARLDAPERRQLVQWARQQARSNE